MSIRLILGVSGLHIWISKMTRSLNLKKTNSYLYWSVCPPKFYFKIGCNSFFGSFYSMPKKPSWNYIQYTWKEKEIQTAILLFSSNFKVVLCFIEELLDFFYQTPPPNPLSISTLCTVTAIIIKYLEYSQCYKHKFLTAVNLFKGTVPWYISWPFHPI